MPHLNRTGNNRARPYLAMVTIPALAYAVFTSNLRKPPDYTEVDQGQAGAEATQVMYVGSVDAYTSFVRTPSQGAEYVKEMYQKADPNIDFVDLTSKVMTVKEYSENVDTETTTAGMSYEDTVPGGTENASDLLLVVAFKTHSRVERLGLQRMSPGSDIPDSVEGFLSTSDGMMGVVHALNAETLATYSTVMYTSGAPPDLLEKLIAFSPASHTTPTPGP